MNTKEIKLPPMPEWAKMDNLGGLCPSEIRSALSEFACEAVRLNVRAVPDGWKWRRRPVDKWVCVGHWDSVEAKAAEQMEADGWEVVRLYRAAIDATMKGE